MSIESYEGQVLLPGAGTEGGRDAQEQRGIHCVRRAFREIQLSPLRLLFSRISTDPQALGGEGQSCQQSDNTPAPQNV